LSSAIRIALVFVLAVFAAGTARAAELVPAISSEIGYDSNNEGRTSNEDGSARVRTTPEISLRETVGRLAFDANLRVAYDNALDFTDADDYFDQFANLGVVWTISSRTELSLSNQFARIENIDRTVAVDSFALEEVPDNEDRRTRNIRNRSVLSLSHRLTSRWTAFFSGDYLLRTFRTENRPDRTALSGTTSLSYALNARTSVNFGARAIYDSYEQSTRRRGSRARYYQAFTGLQYLIAPDLRMSVQGGPVWVDQTTNPGNLDFRTYPFVTSFMGFRPQDFLDPSVDPSQDFGFVLDQSTCPVLDGVSYASEFTSSNPDGCLIASFTPVLMTTANNPVKSGQPRVAGSSNDSSGWDFFTNFELVKTWEWGDVGLSYNRRESSTGGSGNSAIADSISLVASGFEPAPLWTLGGLFNWTQRDSTGREAADIAAVVPVNLLVDENGNINGSGTLTPIIGAGESRGYVTEGSFKNAYDVTSYLVELRAERRLTEKLVTYAKTSWRRDERSGELQSNNNLDIFRIFVGLRYTFDPLLF
jgi:hypothetical protein